MTDSEREILDRESPRERRRMPQHQDLKPMTIARHAPRHRFPSKARTRALTTASALAMLAGLSGAAEAYDLPNVNLGFTSFLDGAPPAGPGWYPTQYFQFYTADRLTDRHGDRLPCPSRTSTSSSD